MPQTKKRTILHKKKQIHSAQKKETPAHNAVILSEDVSDIQSEDLQTMYELDDRVDRTDMTKMEQKRHRGRWVAVAVVAVFILVIISYLGFRIFRQSNGSNTGDVTLTMSIDKKIASGDAVTLEITYMNNKNTEVSLGNIEVIYPDGFYFESASEQASDDQNRSWNIEHIQPGTGGKIRISGQLVGAKDEKKEFSALLTYQLSNFSHDFQSSVKTSTIITASNIDVRVILQEQVQSGQKLTYTVEYTNTSPLPIKNVKVMVQYPHGFTYESASLEPSSNKNEWKIESLEPNTKQSIEITGVLDGTSGEKKEFQFQLGIMELDNTFNMQIETTSNVTIVNPEIELNISAPQFVSPGEQVPITVVLKNTSTLDVKKVGVHVTLEGALFAEHTYTFEKIQKLAAYEEKELAYTATLKEQPTKGNQTLRVSARIDSAIVEGNDVTFANETSVDMKVKGLFGITIEGRYFDDNLKKIGSGPLPPIVGETTTYVIVWDIANGFNEMENVNITTSLPQSVVWKGVASNTLKYDADTRRVSFSKDRITGEKDMHLTFEVSITPSKENVDSLMVLTNTTTVTATDQFTKESINEEKDRITTDLPTDEGATGKGVIEQDL
ncbi:MAG TPA: hypothetical protein VJB65_03325 [Patescibacteria group bacterium]|nr:hypothetical protein [Patescibacteria group bacterium]